MRRRYFIPISPQEYLVLISSTLEVWKTESTLELLSGFELGNPGLGIQDLNHYWAIALTLDPKVLGLASNYMLGQALGPNLNPRLSGICGSYKINAVINNK